MFHASTAFFIRGLNSLGVVFSNQNLIKSYQDPENGNTYLELSDEDISKEFIYFAHIINGTVEAGLFKGSHIDQAVIKFEKQFNSLNLVRVNTEYYFDPNSELSQTE